MSRGAPTRGFEYSSGVVQVRVKTHESPVLRKYSVGLYRIGNIVTCRVWMRLILLRDRVFADDTDMVSKLLDENTANIEKAKSLTAGLSAAQMNWRPQPGKWSIAQNLAHLNFGYQYFDTIASSIAAARAKAIIGNGPGTALSPQ